MSVKKKSYTPLEREEISRKYLEISIQLFFDDSIWQIKNEKKNHFGYKKEWMGGKRAIVCGDI